MQLPKRCKIETIPVGGGGYDIVFRVDNARPVVSAKRDKVHVFEYRGKTGKTIWVDGVVVPVMARVEFYATIPDHKRRRRKIDLIEDYSDHWINRD